MTHPRNKHQGFYPFPDLIKSHPNLGSFVSINQYGNQTVDFSNPLAVKNLNQSLLKFYYDLKWDIPDGFLCPPIPGRADYIHYAADLLSESNGGIIPKGKKVKVLDSGVGANCIYPLIGHCEYGWQFAGSDIDQAAIFAANHLLKINQLLNAIDIRFQPSSSFVFKNIVKKDDFFELAICNPPFHSSLNEAQMGTERKWKNLKIKSTALNFGGRGHELWCPGGEVAFIKQMIKESIFVNCHWFTALVSKKENLSILYQALTLVNPFKVKTIEMGQGQKQSRFIAWSFQ